LVTLEAHFAVLKRDISRGKARPRDTSGASVSMTGTVSGFLTRMTQQPGIAQLGLEESSAVSVALTPTVTGVVVPGTSGTCLIVQLPPVSQPGLNPRAAGPSIGATCNTNAKIVEHGINLSVTSADGTDAWGLVPNGNSTVSIATANNTTVTAPVVDNLYFASVSENLTSVSFLNTSGDMIQRGL
jgi:hypothetical protein